MEFGARDVLSLLALALSVGGVVAYVSARMASVEAVQVDHARRLAEVTEEIRRQRDATSSTREELAEMRGQLENIGQQILTLQGEVRTMQGEVRTLPGTVAAAVTAAWRDSGRAS